jgi:hypothetical protein
MQQQKGKFFGFCRVRSAREGQSFSFFVEVMMDRKIARANVMCVVAIGNARALKVALPDPGPPRDCVPCWRSSQSFG